MATERLDYRLAYWQTVLHPAGGFLTLIFGSLCGLGAFLSARGMVSDPSRWVMPAVLLLCAFLCLLCRSSKRRAPRYMVWNDDGVDHDLGDCMLGGLKQRGTVPYKSLTVQSGWGGVTVLKHLTGHFVLIPRSAMSRDKVSEMLERRKKVGGDSSQLPIGATG